MRCCASVWATRICKTADPTKPSRTASCLAAAGLFRSLAAGQSYAEMAHHELALRAYQDGISAADKTGDRQAAKEMAVFARRARKALSASS